MERTIRFANGHLKPTLSPRPATAKSGPKRRIEGLGNILPLSLSPRSLSQACEFWGEKPSMVSPNWIRISGSFVRFQISTIKHGCRFARKPEFVRSLPRLQTVIILNSLSTRIFCLNFMESLLFDNFFLFVYSVLCVRIGRISRLLDSISEALNVQWIRLMEVSFCLWIMVQLNLWVSIEFFASCKFDVLSIGKMCVLTHFGSSCLCISVVMFGNPRIA